MINQLILNILTFSLIYLIKRLLKTYLELNKQQIFNILNSNSRYITIFNDYPRRVLSYNGSYLL